jgi:hypothetical protein
MGRLQRPLIFNFTWSLDVSRRVFSCPLIGTRDNVVNVDIDDRQYRILAGTGFWSGWGLDLDYKP